MRLVAWLALAVLAGLPQLSRGEYIQITTPEPQAYYCAPSVIRWDSDIDPEAGEVIHVKYKHELWSDWSSLGLTTNDGEQPWPSAPCYTWDWWGTTERRVRVEYILDPAVFDEVVLWLEDLPIEEPFGVFIDFRGDAESLGDVECRTDPVQYTEFDAYVGLIEAVQEPDTGGFRSVSFALEIGPPGVLVPDSHIENLLPGGLSIGSWDTGVTLASTDCVHSLGDVVYLARLSVFYLGGAADIVIHDHPEYPKWVVNCDDPGEALHYEVIHHGGVGKDPVSTPVQNTSWGAIKAMFRE